MAKLETFPNAACYDGVGETLLRSWTDFDEVVRKTLDLPDLIFRGHRRNDWFLEPSLTRVLKKRSESDFLRKYERITHLDNFKMAARGRRGVNPPNIEDDNGWWSLGQHHGLATPLLDWTTSPYVALFFAFYENNTDDETETRVVFSLNTLQVREKCKGLVGGLLTPALDPDDIVEIHKPLSDENARLVNQAGLFTKSPDGVDIESWIRKQFYNINNTGILNKIYIPNQGREDCLKALNKMNINHATLFPDLSGAARFSNMRLEIDRY